MKKVLSFILVFAVMFSVFSLSVSADEEEYYGEPVIDISGGYMYLENVRDISPYENKENINEICLVNCFIDQDTKIFSHKKLKDVRLVDCTYEKGAYRFPDNIKILQLEGAVPDNVINGIGNVEELTFWGYEGTDMKALSGLKNIKNLSFADSNIKSLKGIEKLTSLEKLDLDAVGISNIDELKHLTKLKELSITNTFIEDISPIQNLKLVYLDLDNNYNLKSFDPVMKISTLETLWTKNGELSYSEELFNYIKNKKINSDVEASDLKIRPQIEALTKKLVNSRMSDEEKIGRIVTYICDNMEYTLPDESEVGVYKHDQLLSKYNDEALKYALKGEGCCANYAALTFALLTEAGIDTYCVNGLEHIWNLVETDGYFYWLDTTWIDTGYDDLLEESFWYMNSSEDFTISHEYYAIPAVAMSTDAFSRTYVNTMSFKIKRAYDVSPEEETEAESTTAPPETTTEEVTEKVTSEETTDENKEDPTDGAYAEEKGSSGKKILIVAVIVVAVVGLGAAAVILIKRKKQDIEKTELM